MKCLKWFQFHKWGKWSIDLKGDLLVPGTSRRVGSYIIQERNCERCGFIQRNKKETV
jgi:hypothetical protein